MAGNADLLEMARRLSGEGGRADPIALEQLAGGKNNRVYRVALSGGEDVVLKSYFHDPRDRLGAEWNFLTFAWTRGVRCLPEPLACDREALLGLYGFCGGAKLAAEAITAAHIDEAAACICAVNRGERPRAALKPGSEACFSVLEHLARIDQRIARLGTLDPQAPHAEEAAAFICETLTPRWQHVRGRVRDVCAARGIVLDAPIPESEIIASPSDFGFHNALWEEGRGLSFLDFEYAGWDDPAKLAGDFFGCPEIPAPGTYFARFTETLCDQLKLGEAARARMDMLRDAYRIKWACIVLNDFVASEDARRRFANSGDRVARCKAQLEKAAGLIKVTEDA